MQKKIILSIISVIVVVVVLASVVLYITLKGDTEETKDVWTATELYYDMGMPFSSDGIVIDFKSLEEGDLVIIHDTIDDIQFRDWEDTAYTEVSFEVDEWASLSYNFEGDITSTFQIGDKVAITFHIKHLEGIRYDNDSNTSLSYVVEFPAEGFDQEYFDEKVNVIMPISCIKKI